MTSFILKIIGIVTMTIDHIGIFFYPDIICFRIIGRLAFPIFAFLISEGYRKTSNLKAYIVRMLVFAFFSQLVFVKVFRNLFRDVPLNILFTFILALCAIYIYEKRGKLYMVFLIALAAEFLNTDYGVYGVLLVFIFHKFHDNFKDMAKYVSLLTITYVFFNLMGAYTTNVSFSRLFQYSIQLFAIPSLIFIYFYNQKRGLALKYLFYIFYPGHLLLLYYLRELITKIRIERLLR